MRHSTLVSLTANSVFDDSALLRSNRSGQHARPEFPRVSGCAALFILISGILGSVAVMGDELIFNQEPSSGVGRNSPDVSELSPDQVTRYFAPHDENALPCPEGLESSADLETFQNEQMTNESFPSVGSGTLEEYPPIATPEILMPMTSGLQLPQKTFVHEPRLVRMSERSAEIWVTLPERAYVSVNFVEYPPEGTFRVFRTKFATREPRRYYISARLGRGKDQIALSPSTMLSIDEATGWHFVDLCPGQQVVIVFPNVEAQSGHGEAQSNQSEMARSDETLHALEGKLDAILEKLGPGDSAIESLIQAQTDQITNSHAESVKFHRQAARSLRPIATIQQALAPRDASASVTRQFHFDGASLKVTGKATVLDGQVTAIDWTNHPVSVSLVAPKSIKALPSRPFEAKVTFWLRKGVAEPFSTFEPMTVQFDEAGENVFAKIAFIEQFAGSLTDALVEAQAGPGDYYIGATVSYDLDLDELGQIVVTGEIGNKIQLTIQP